MEKQERIKLAQDSGSAAPLLTELSHDEEWEVRIRVAGNVRSPEQVLRKLSLDSNLSVRSALARNPSTPFETLMQLAKDGSEYVRDGVIVNPGTSAEEKRRLKEEVKRAKYWVYETRDIENTSLMEKWKDQYRPRPIESDYYSRNDSLYIYDVSPKNLAKLRTLDITHIWSLRWGSEDIFLVEGLRESAGPEYVGYVVTEVSWRTKKTDNSIVCVESPAPCEFCEGLGEDEAGETCYRCDGSGEFWVNYGL